MIEYPLAHTTGSTTTIHSHDSRINGSKTVSKGLINACKVRQLWCGGSHVCYTILNVFIIDEYAYSLRTEHKLAVKFKAGSSPVELFHSRNTFISAQSHSHEVATSEVSGVLLSEVETVQRMALHYDMEQMSKSDSVFAGNKPKSPNAAVGR